MIKDKGSLVRDFTSESNSNSSGVVVVGDVHGCADALKELVEKVGELPYSPTLVFVGDLLDRGSKGVEVWDFVRKLYNSPESFGVKEVVVLKGNHEQMLIDAIDSGSMDSQKFVLWEENGGRIEDLFHILNKGTSEVEWIRSREHFYIHESKVNSIFGEKYLLVTHACVKPYSIAGDVHLQDVDNILWNRKFAGYDQDWLTVHGHTIQRYGPSSILTPTGVVMLIDTGSFFTGVVTGVEFVNAI